MILDRGRLNDGPEMDVPTKQLHAYRWPPSPWAPAEHQGGVRCLKHYVAAVCFLSYCVHNMCIIVLPFFSLQSLIRVLIKKPLCDELWVFPWSQPDINPLCHGPSTRGTDRKTFKQTHQCDIVETLHWQWDHKRLSWRLATLIRWSAWATLRNGP